MSALPQYQDFLKAGSSSVNIPIVPKTDTSHRCPISHKHAGGHYHPLSSNDVQGPT
ncbi:hypothetical protein [Comamonas kerstersii]|uniref:hypothetical protein n=1 Tax=Comamonas kerstersii TaxID=225992 RepID=UPI003A8EF241